MKTEEFNKIVLDRCEKTMATLTRKAAEYARGDRLSNFKAAAGFLQCTPERALMGMKIKHDVSIRDMVDDLQRGSICHIWSQEKWDEKIGDAVNYLILLEALVRERLAAEEEDAPPDPAAPAPVVRSRHAKPHRR